MSENEFAYHATKDGRISISWRGKPVVMLRGERAERFLRQAQSCGDEALQLLMARATGNFKRGNERERKNRRRG
jgi:hypothetical protein